MGQNYTDENSDNGVSSDDNENVCCCADAVTIDKAELVAHELDNIRLREGNSLGYGKTVAKSLGISYAMIFVSKSSGLISDLEDAFGNYGKVLLHRAISKVVIESRKGLEKSILEGDMTAELLGIADVDRHIECLEPSTPWDSRALSHFLELRSRRAGGIYLYESSLIEMEGTGCNLMLLSDTDGIPIIYHLEEGTVSKFENGFELKSILDSIGDISTTVVCGLGYTTKETYKGLRERDIAFILEVDSEFLVALGIDDPSDASPEVSYMDGKPYEVFSAVLQGCVPGDSRLVPKVWAYRPKETDTIDRTRVERRLYTIEYRLKSLDPETALEQFKSTAGRLSRFFDISLKEGKLDLRIRRKDLDDYINPHPTYLLTNGFYTWSDVMAGVDSRSRFQSIRSAMSEMVSAEFPGYVGDGFREEVLVDFISLIIRSHMAKVLRDSGTGIDVPTSLEWLSSLMCIGDGSEWQVVGMTPRNRRVLSALGVVIPKRIVL